MTYDTSPLVALMGLHDTQNGDDILNVFVLHYIYQQYTTHVDLVIPQLNAK